ncbi:hypothetical protein [Oricola sp.]|uniref:hypothetical protein n=1 Tax=Oricola sp. TaxID=1979950 RepID=UPI0025F3008D|nr:hypothetical protein [Oricola sp.]MCI5074769.1 hypothetical protein [Oricola sp.]
MMKSYTHWINGAAILGVAAMLTVGYGIAEPGIDKTTTASIDTLRQADRFMVVDHAHNRTCIVALHRAKGYDVHRVEPGHCSGMPKELLTARAWQDTETGKVRITDHTGKVLMRLSAKDQFGWDVVEPKALSLSFEAF